MQCECAVRERGARAATAAASVTSCARRPLQRFLRVPYHTETCKVL